MERLTVVIPAYNEAEGLPSFLPGVIRQCAEKNWKLIVVNDGSMDGTGNILDEFNAHPHFQVIHHKMNRGYGGAIKTGIRASKTELVVTIDADGQHVPAEIDNLLDALESSDADMVVGSRLGGQNSNPYRSLGKWLIRKIAKTLLPVPIYDINSGMKMYRTDLAKMYLELCPDSMALSDVITLVFIHQRRRVIEEPIVIRERHAGTSAVKTRTAFDTIMEILHIVTLCNPMRIFLPVSIFCLLAGVVWGLPIVLQGKGVSVGATLSILTGLIFFLLGLVAEQISAIRLERIKKNGAI